MLVTVLRREQEADIAKVEYLASVFTIVTGLDAKTFDKKVKALDALKESMAATVRQDAYKWGYHKRQVDKAVAEKKREGAMLHKLANLGKKD